VLLGEIARDGVGMINKKNVCVVLPAYNAARTLGPASRPLQSSPATGEGGNHGCHNMD
jgi:hypothetical protein